MIEIKYQQRVFEISAVVLTGCCKFLFVDILPYKFWFILFASFFWIGYVLFRSRRTKGILVYWGFRKESFFITFKRLLPFGLICIATFLIFGITQNTIILNWHIVPTLLLYPLWGIVQQFLIVGLVAGNLYDLKGNRVPKILIVIITSIIFSVVHFPSLYLAAGTFILAVVYTITYLKTRNIWALGLYHGWLGAFYYFFVLHRDPWNEVFRTL
jgi:membrane protease YdiL (CAAX protease family)